MFVCVCLWCGFGVLYLNVLDSLLGGPDRMCLAERAVTAPRGCSHQCIRHDACFDSEILKRCLQSVLSFVPTVATGARGRAFALAQGRGNRARGGDLMLLFSEKTAATAAA